MGIDSCEYFIDRIALYTIPEFAALWCGVQKESLAKILGEATTASTSAQGMQIISHPKYPCLKPKCMFICNAILEGKLQTHDETGSLQPLEPKSHSAWHRKHIRADKAIEWLEETDIPVQDMPAFLYYPQKKAEKALDARTETTYRIIIYSLLKHIGKEPFPRDEKGKFTLHRNLTSWVQKWVEMAGFSLHQDTIRDILKGLELTERKIRKVE